CQSCRFHVGKMVMARKRMRTKSDSWTDYDDKLLAWLNGSFDAGGLRQKDLAHRLGLPGSALSRLCKGERRLAAAHLRIIEDFFGQQAPGWKLTRKERKGTEDRLTKRINAMRSR